MSAATSSEDRLPRLSAGAWFAMLPAGFFIIFLVFYPVVIHPTIRRILKQRVLSALTEVVISRWFSVSIGAVALVMLISALIGDRPPKQRNVLVYAALVVAMLGAIAVVLGIRVVGQLRT